MNKNNYLWRYTTKIRRITYLNIIVRSIYRSVRDAYEDDRNVEMFFDMNMNIYILYVHILYVQFDLCKINVESTKEKIEPKYQHETRR